MPEKRNTIAVVVRLLPEIADIIKKQAAVEKISVTEKMRRMIQRDMEREKSVPK